MLRRLSISPIIIIGLCTWSLSAVFSWNHQLPPTPLRQQFSQVLLDPFGPVKHYSLAALYEQAQLFDLAVSEKSLVADATNETSLEILGALSNNPQLQEVAYWHKVNQLFPNYRDGWIQLLYLDQLTQNAETKRNYLSQIQRLDPNYPQEQLLIMGNE